MYDARQSGPSTGGNTIFAIVALLVVSCAFGLAWVFGAPSTQPAKAPKLHASVPAALADTMPSADEIRFLNAVAEIQPAALAPLESGLAREAGDREAQIELIGQTAGMAIFANMDALGQISVADLNSMLDTTLAQVRRAKASGSALCQGRTWAQFENADEAQVKRWMAANGYTHERMYPDSMAIMADFLEALSRAKTNPARHGSFRSSDQTALEQAMFGLMANPEIMQLAASGGSDREQIARTDVCAIGEVLIQTVRDLPDGTKGRAWAAAFDRPEFDQALDMLDGFNF